MKYYSVSEMSFITKKKYNTVFSIVKRLKMNPVNKIGKTPLYSKDQFDEVQKYIKTINPGVTIYEPVYIIQEFHIYESKINKK